MPLTEMLKNNVPLEWKVEQEASFGALKIALTTATVLVLPDFERPFLLTCDASGKAIGGVLAQLVEGCERLIAFESKKLSSAEQNYPTHDQELLAIVHRCKVYRCFIEGRKTIVRTDHAPLKFLKTQKLLSRRVTRWLEFLVTLDIEIEYKPGKENVGADALSRPVEINPIEASDLPSIYSRYPENRSQVTR